MSETQSVGAQKVCEPPPPFLSNPPRPWSLDKSWLVERPSRDPQAIEAWCYTDQMTYRAGQIVRVHMHATTATVTLKVVRDGISEDTVIDEGPIPAVTGPTPINAYESGCEWPVGYAFTVKKEWRPGLYLVIIRAEDAAGRCAESEHFIVVRASNGAGTPALALVLTTSTLHAYNDWGGANMYRGLPASPGVDLGAPVVSMRRPIARGFLKLPPGAPRDSHPNTPPPMAKPSYPSLEWALANGYSRHYSNAFWATYERHFVTWAEHEGYELDYVTQHDLHSDPHTLDGYDGIVLVGHDEYWSWAMRDALDAFVNGGGHVARFAGNFLWQVRISEDGAQQTCYKVPSADPLWAKPETRHLTTTAWDVAGRPGAQSIGVTGLAGVYNRYGSAAARSAGGFTIYRPGHWAFENTGLSYGDQLGPAPVCVAAFELDGLNYTVKNGLPYPTERDHPPGGLEILAMAPAVLGEIDWWNGRVALNAPEADIYELFDDLHGAGAPEVFESYRYGCGMVVAFDRGAGSVFTAGSAEWVSGLASNDPFVEQVTRNVLDRILNTGRGV